MENSYDTEYDGYYEQVYRNINPNKTALILMDIWDTSKEANDGWAKRHDTFVKESIVPLVKFARKNNILVIHASHDYKISDRIKVIEGEKILSVGKWPRKLQTLYLYWYLMSNDIEHLIYAGNSTHKCVFFRPDGVYEMSKLLDDIIVIRDATIAFEYHETREGEWAKNVFINLIEDQYGSSTTLEDLQNAL